MICFHSGIFAPDLNMSYEYNPRSLGNPLFKLESKQEKTSKLPVNNSSDSEDVPTIPKLSLGYRDQNFTEIVNREANIWKNLPVVKASDVPAHFVNQLDMGRGRKDKEAKKDETKSLSRIMDEVSPPNVVIGNQFPPVQSQTLNLSMTREGSSSPEVENQFKISNESVPPNITITSRTLPISVQNSFPNPQRQPHVLPNLQVTPFSGEIRVPTSFQASNFHLKVLGEDSNPPRSQKPEFSWMENPDSLSSVIQNTPVADLLKNPDIINNQTNSLTKALYAMKGFAQDFRDLRIKSLYTEDDVSHALQLVYGQEFNSKLILDFEKLFLPLHSFLRIRPVMEKWITSLRPNDVVAPCPDWNLPIEIARDRKRKMSSSDSDDRERRRLRKRTKINQESKQLLEAAYQTNPKPSGPNLLALARRINLDRDVVRVWFANRRQKAKKQPTSHENQAGPSAPNKGIMADMNIPNYNHGLNDNMMYFEENNDDYDDHNSDFDDYQDTFMQQTEAEFPNPHYREPFHSKTSVIVQNTGSPFNSGLPLPASPQEPSMMTPEIMSPVTTQVDQVNESDQRKSADEWDPLLLSFM